MIEGVYMTQKETKRIEVLTKVNQKKLTQSQAAIELNLSLRQVQRLCRLYYEDGTLALASKKRGRPNSRSSAVYKLSSKIFS